MDVIFKGRHTDVLGRFRKHAAAKLARIGRLDQRAVRVDVEVSAERNPRQAERRERVELTISSRGPAIRAEAAAEDRYAALDMALAKLESRLRRASDRRKGRHAGRAGARAADTSAAASPASAAESASAASTSAMSKAAATVATAGDRPGDHARTGAAEAAEAVEAAEAAADGRPPDDFVAIEMEGDGPLVVREKFHGAQPMSIDQALFEMELVGHDFFLFRDAGSGHPSVVYRRFGYQYGVIRLVEEPANGRPDGSGAAPVPEQASRQRGRRASGQPREAERLGAR